MKVFDVKSFDISTIDLELIECSMMLNFDVKQQTDDFVPKIST